jgi:hypothetical protein
MYKRQQPKSLEAMNTVLKTNADVRSNPTRDEGCEPVREEFSAYLDGAVSGVQMAAISSHLEDCNACSVEFEALRDVQSALGQMGVAQPPARLQAHLREAIAEERVKGTHLPWMQRLSLAWDRTLAPMALRFSGALAVALILAGSLGWLFSAPIAVQANDDRLANLVGPHYLYSQVPPQPIMTHRDVPIVVEAKVNTSGRVYDYAILEGPTDQQSLIGLEQNLLASVFRPATVFGVPVRGHVVLTYTGVSVKG